MNNNIKRLGIVMTVGGLIVAFASFVYQIYADSIQPGREIVSFWERYLGTLGIIVSLLGTSLTSISKKQ
jgi:hypothetical protein